MESTPVGDVVYSNCTGSSVETCHRVGAPTMESPDRGDRQVPCRKGHPHRTIPSSPGWMNPFPSSTIVTVLLSTSIILAIVWAPVAVMAAPPSPNKDVSSSSASSSSSSSTEVQVPYNPSVFATVFGNVPYVRTVGGKSSAKPMQSSAAQRDVDKDSSRESSATSEDYADNEGYPSGFWTYLLRPGFAFQSDSQLKETTNSTSDDEVPSHQKGKCKDGLIIPAWHPLEPLSMGDRWARGIIYFLGLVYMFVGISIIADRFMAAIEVITSLERQVSRTEVLPFRVWACNCVYVR